MLYEDFNPDSWHFDPVLGTMTSINDASLVYFSTGKTVSCQSNDAETPCVKGTASLTGTSSEIINKYSQPADPTQKTPTASISLEVEAADGTLVSKEVLKEFSRAEMASIVKDLVATELREQAAKASEHSGPS